LDSRKKDVFKGVLVGGLVGIALGLGGFFLAEIPGTHAMGLVVFVVVPLAAGFAVTLVSRKAEWAAVSTLLSLIASLALLIATRMEGVLCALLAFPLLFAGLMLGVGLGYLLQRIMAKHGGNSVTFTSAALLSMPLLIFAGHRVEVATLTHPRHEVVTSTVRLGANLNQVWDDLRSFDSLAGEKPLLMHVGLPIPTRCVMEGSGEGAKRTCYFDQGYIQETVIGWSPPNVMLLSIDRTNMPGRHWLVFEYARYELRWNGSQTVLTRTTAIISNLYPAWYWRTFERWGVRSEHEYIFNDLARRLPPSSPVY
jgi:F0F1-type ATP synthase assembly protein I